jgi:hypothetical protein
MSKRKARQQKRAASVVASQGQRKVVAVFALLLCLSLAGGIFAQWRAARVPTAINALLAPPPALTLPAANSPSKEYIYAGGRLLATEEPAASATPSGNSIEDVFWAASSLAGVTPSGNSLTKTASSVWGNAGASSTRAIASGDGYMEFTATNLGETRIAGLSHDDTDQSWQDIDFGIDATGEGSVYIVENGTVRGPYGTYSAGNKFRVSVESGVVNYYKEGALFYTSTVTPVYPLLVDTALLNTGASINNAVISGTALQNVQALENVSWANALGVTVSGNNLTMTAADGWGNAGASSTQSIASGDGYVEFTATNLGETRICGLSNGDTNQSWQEIDFGIDVTASGDVYVVENGTVTGPYVTYSAGNKFRVSVESGAVKYYKEGSLFYTHTITPSYPLLVDTALLNTGASINNVVIKR